MGFDRLPNCRYPRGLLSVPLVQLCLHVIQFTVFVRLRYLFLRGFRDHREETFVLFVHYLIYLHMSWYMVCGTNLTSLELFLFNTVPPELSLAAGWLFVLVGMELYQDGWLAP
jgi:hypothetical protein